MNHPKNLFKHGSDWWQTRQSHSRTGQSRNHWLPTPGNIIFTLLTVILVVFTQQVWANSAQSLNAPGSSATTINYQGNLASPNGSPKNGSFDMSFAIYNAASGGRRFHPKRPFPGHS